jgi:hypothetical protein
MAGMGRGGDRHEIRLDEDSIGAEDGMVEEGADGENRFALGG